MTYNESDCLQQALQGSDEAFTALVERYQTPVYNLCYRMLGSPQEAEDAAQETFWRAYQHLHRYDPNRSFATWLLSIAAHYCIDQQRRSRAVLIPLDGMIEEIMADPAPLPERSAARSQEATALRQLLNSLTPHLTLTRQMPSAQAAEITRSLPAFKPIEFKVRQLTLMQSVPEAGHMRYDPLHRSNLSG